MDNCKPYLDMEKEFFRENAAIVREVFFDTDSLLGVDSEEDLDTYKYSEYPETGISAQQHVPQAIPGPAAAAAGPQPAAAAPGPAAGVPAAAGGILHLAPAAPAPVPPAAPPQPLPVAAAAAAGPADAADDYHPAEWQVLSPLPPDSSDDSFNDEFQIWSTDSCRPLTFVRCVRKSAERPTAGDILFH